MRSVSSMTWVTCGQEKGVPAKEIYFPRGNKYFQTKTKSPLLFDKSWNFSAKHSSIIQLKKILNKQHISSLDP